MNQTKLQTTLVYGGILPFIILTILTHEPLFWTSTTYAKALLAYAAMILSFLGGMVWGVSMTHLEQARAELIISNGIALISWAALLLTNHSAAILLIVVTMLTTLILDYRFYQMQVITHQFLKLRIKATLVVVMTLLLHWLLIGYHI